MIATSSLNAPAGTALFRRQVIRDERIRAKSREKRAELLDAVVEQLNPDDGLRRQAEFYRRRLEAGMEHPDES